MNKREHVLNAFLLGVGVGYLLQPTDDVAFLATVAALAVPITLGALVPDVDTVFGSHRKTLHNLPLLALFLAYPLAFGNLQWVWLGVLSHYVLDLLGTTRGLALGYPLLNREFGVPVGVPVDSRQAPAVMLAVTAFELAVAWYVLYELDPALLEAIGSAVGLAA